MTTRLSGLLGTVSALAIAACGGEFTTQATQATNDADAAAGGATTTGGSTSTGGTTGTGGRTGTGGYSIGNGGTNPNTGGASAGGSIGAGGAGSVAENDFRTALIQVYCGAFVECCSTGGIVFDQAKCEASFASLAGTSLSSPRSGYYTFDAAAASRCLDTLSTSIAPTCSTIPASIACEGVFQGVLKPGDPCNAAVECAHGPGDSPSCEPGPDGSTTICILKRRATEGEPCVQNCTESAGVTTCSGMSTTQPDRGRCFSNDGLYCSNGVCVRQVPVGSECNSNPGCASNARCDLSVSICVPLADVGKPCAVTTDCREELHCSMGQCVPDFAPGDPCTQSSECGTGSCRSGTCSPLGIGIAVLCATLSGAIPIPTP
jgi:hypothetical protein